MCSGTLFMLFFPNITARAGSTCTNNDFCK